MRYDPSGWITRITPEDIERYTASGAWPNTTVWTVAMERLRKDGERIAVVDGTLSFTFNELITQAHRLSRALHASGLKAGDVISFQLPNWHETMVINLAAARLGLVCNPIVPIYRDAELRHILRDAHAKLYFIPRTFRSIDYPAVAARLRADLPELREVIVLRGSTPDCLTYDALLARADANPSRTDLSEKTSGTDPKSLSYFDVSDKKLGSVPGTDPNNVKLVMYTSGTTGAAKGVLHSHNTIAAEIEAVRAFWGVTQRDVVLMPSPVTHITGYLYALEIAFAAGVKVVFMEKWNAAEAVDLIVAHGVTFSVGATPFLKELTSEVMARGTTLPSMRLFMSGGAPVPPEVIHRANDILPNGMAFRVYGSTEAPTVTLGIQSRDQGDLGAVTDGRIVNHEVRLRDPVTGAAVTQGEGEICTRGPEMMLGYTHWPHTQEAFDTDGYFATGDLAYTVEKDYLCVSGRKKDLIIRGGENISPKEIEDVLHTHSAIQEAAVVAMPHERLGEGVAAFLILKGDEVIDVASVARFLEQHGLARQKFPERIEIVRDLPRTPSGKVQKNVLRDRLAAQREGGRAI